MIKTDQITWTKVDINDSSTWPDGNHTITVILKNKNTYWDGTDASIFTGRMRVYKTVLPKFRACFSIRRDEFTLEEIDYWTIINTKLD